MSKELFQFRLGKSLASSAGSDDVLYKVFGVPGKSDVLEVRWNYGGTLYSREAVETNLKDGDWVKRDAK